ncbi:hypothetical protein FRC02_008034 [Tulasnella sp. 418]|nr:hypothetical protein FRC02_008034 [Tulasnella sp. 418]
MSKPVDIPAVKRQLKIKTGVVKRLSKELTLYNKEAEAQQRKYDEFKAKVSNEEDEAKLRSEETMLKEAKKMVPDAESRLSKAVLDLREFTVATKDIPELKDDQDLIAAKEALEEAEM